MVRKLLIAAAIVVVVSGAGVYSYAQTILASDLVRRQVETRLTTALGQPVSIGTIRAAIFPRVTIALGDVRVGQPARVAITRLDLGTSMRALLSRRIEGATARLSGARVELPLPRFAFGAVPAPSDNASSSGITIGSIDAVILEDVEVVSGGRTLRGNADLVPHGDSLTIRAVTLGMDDADLSITGEITNIHGPVGALTVTAGQLDLLALHAFTSDFAAGAAVADNAPAQAAAAPAAPMDLTATITAERATAASLVLQNVSGRARLTREDLTLDPIAFRVFDGQYTGALGLGLASLAQLRLRASLDGVDMATFMRFVGQNDLVTGRFSGDLTLSARGLSSDAIVETAQGTANMNITQGTVKGLGLVRAVIVGTSGRTGAQIEEPATEAEPFSRLGGSMTISGGVARTSDLRFESNDVLLTATGSIALDGRNIDLAGPLQLSDALSQQAGRDLVRYTQQDGRVTIPARITGSASALQVTVDAASLLRRAITNKATEEAGEAIRRGLGGLLGR